MFVCAGSMFCKHLVALQNGREREALRRERERESVKDRSGVREEKSGEELLEETVLASREL